MSHRRSVKRHKTEVVTVRVTAEEKAEIAAFAAAHGMTVSTLMLTCFTLAQTVESQREVAHRG